MMENRVQQVKKMFNDGIIINLEKENIVEIVRNYSNDQGSDVTITACPSGEAQEQSIKLATKRGKISLYGGLPGESQGFLDSNIIHYKELLVFGVQPLRRIKIAKFYSGWKIIKFK